MKDGNVAIPDVWNSKVSSHMNQHTLTRGHSRSTGHHHSSWLLRSGLTLGLSAALTLTGAYAPIGAFAAEDDVVTINVTKFGVEPNSGNDAADAIEAAMEEARTHKASGKKVVINFPKGRYDIYPDNAPQHTLYVSNTVALASSTRTSTSVFWLRT